jgi:hypothetical protein
METDLKRMHASQILEFDLGALSIKDEIKEEQVSSKESEIVEENGPSNSIMGRQTVKEPSRHQKRKEGKKEGGGEGISKGRGEGSGFNAGFKSTRAESYRCVNRTLEHVYKTGLCQVLTFRSLQTETVCIYQS